MFSSLSNAKGFVMIPSNVYGTYTTPDTGLWWKAMQEHVNFPGAVIAPLTIYSDQTSISNDKQVEDGQYILQLLI